MSLEKIISIAGKPGLFQIITQGKNSVIVESLLDKKRFPAFSAEKISSLDEISIYTNEDSIPLAEVFEKIFVKEDGGEAINPKSSANDLKKYFEEVLPDYNQDAVFVSDIMKVMKWYNILQSLDMIKIEEKKEEEDKKEEKVEKVEPENKVEKEVKKKKAKTTKVSKKKVEATKSEE